MNGILFLMKLKLVFLFVLWFLFSIVIVSADYDIPSKYQKTEYNSSKWIQSYHNCTLNESLGLFYLDTYVSNVYEDFTSFSENDALNRLSQTNTRSIFTGISRDDNDIELYKHLPNLDMDFNLTFTLYIDSIVSDTRTSRFIIISWCEIDNDEKYHYDNNLEMFGIELRSYLSTTEYALVFKEVYNGNRNQNAGNSGLDVDTNYYCRFSRDGTTLRLWVYTDPEMTVEHPDYTPQTLTLNGDWSNCDYLCAPQSLGSSVNLQSSGYIEYLWFGNTTKYCYPQGLIYTKDLLENETEKSVMIGLNSIAYLDTLVNLYVSDDNTTWKLLIQNNGLGSLSQYHEILYNYSSLYARLNLTTADPLVTPFVDELFYFYTYDCAVSDETKPYVFIILFTIIGMLLGSVIDRT